MGSLNATTPVTTDRLRSAMSRFCTGVVAVSALDHRRPVGMTCQSFVSLSLDPPLISLSPARTSTTFPAIRQATRFAVSVLADDQQHVARALARQGGDKFAGIAWHPGPSGAPVIDDCLAWIDCGLEAEYDGGDHTIVIARVIAMGYRDDGLPLTYFRRAFGSVVTS